MLDVIKSISLPRFPVQDLSLVRHLDYYDGPLLSEFRRKNGERYLYYWCDCDKQVNRWMVLRIAEASILRLANRFVPLDFVIPEKCLDDFVYFVDISSTGKIVKTRLTDVDEIPDEYKPSSGSYIQHVIP